MLKETRGGVDPSEVTEVAVNPIGFPLAVFEVIIATPEACIRKAVLSASCPNTGNFEIELVIAR